MDAPEMDQGNKRRGTPLAGNSPGSKGIGHTTLPAAGLPAAQVLCGDRAEPELKLCRKSWLRRLFGRVA